jgi:signal transduction histidine kinase
MSKRVEACGARIEWDVDDIPPLPDLSPHRVLQILRIVQEAISNALRHAQATTLTIRTRLAPAAGGVAPGSQTAGAAPAVLVEVIDDGKGIDPAAPPGHGLRNMHHRAGQIGASLVVERLATGTSVRLLLPLDPPAPRG